MEQNNNFRESFELGGVYEFKIIDIFPANYCKIVDVRQDVDTYLRNIAKLNLKKNQIIKCRVVGFDAKRPFVELVDAQDYKSEESQISEELLSEKLQVSELNWNAKDFIRLITSKADEKTFENHAHKWIQQQINKKFNLSAIQDDCARLLENSDFLTLCNQQEREFYQDRMTLVLELIDYYNTASEIVNADKANNGSEMCNEFIDTLFAKLKISGFIYHPKRNLNILTCLFLLRPDIMNARIRELLDIICNREYAMWNRDLFKNAIIKVLELYISHNEDKIDKIKDNSALVDNMLLALHLQMFLIDTDIRPDDVDLRMLQARLCILSTYKQDSMSVDLINAAYFNLFNSEITKYALPRNEYILAPYKICNYEISEIDTRLRYINKNVKIDISKDGISLFSDVDSAGLRPVFPAELGLWKNLQIYSSNRDCTKIASSGLKDLNLYRSLWNDIESELLTLKQEPQQAAPVKPKRYKTGDAVKISFIRQDEKIQDKFYCRIEDGNGVEGYIYLKDIVNYLVNVNLRDFYASDDGSRYVFDAHIEEVVDGEYHFSMLEEIKDRVNDGFYGDDEEILCVLGNDPKYVGGNYYSVAVTLEGVGISLDVNDFRDVVCKSDFVTCCLIGKSSNIFNLTCRMTDFTDETFGIKEAFRNLIEEIYVSKIHENTSASKADTDHDHASPLEEKYLRETICLIDRMACIENDYVKSFNYLGFARMLCLLLNLDSQAAYYKGRMDIISNLHYFGLNSTIDEANLKQLEMANAELLSGNDMLKERFLQLQTVSYKGKPHYNAELFNTIQSNPQLKELASLVLAYNIAMQSRLDSAATEIYNKIIQLLNIKGYETGLKSYGVENDVTEFKTSVVYPAGKGITDLNFDTQIKEILRVINAFLNSNGGTLYIGVNNYGLGVGIAEDLKTYYYYGDKDKYIRSIQDAIAKAWGNNILATYVDIRFDADNTDKDVLVITVTPHAKGLTYDNEYYVKVSGTKRTLSKEGYEEYCQLKR